ncbi:MAG: hypothetical protein GWP61_15950 [Chloroflexi bacterium]|jgi:hypothetical protein|nr:hypothetical protein [Chloroflexota bacterium]
MIVSLPRFSWAFILSLALLGCDQSTPANIATALPETATAMPTPIVIVATPTPLGDDVLAPIDFDLDDAALSLATQIYFLIRSYS